MILVTGATGQLGSATLSHLLNNIPPNKVAAFARDHGKAEHLKKKGIDVRIGTYDDVASLEQAFQGIEKVLLISGTDPNRVQQHKNVVDAAKKAGTRHLVYTGISLKDIQTSAVKSVMGSHIQTEDYIKESGLPYTLLHNTLYTDGIPMFAGDNVFETGIVLPAGDGQVPYALRREMGEAAANVLLQDGHENKTYEITGGALYSYADVTKALSELSGKDIAYTDVDAVAFTEQIKQAGVPEFVAFMITGLATDTKNHQFEGVSKDLEHLLGRSPITLDAGLKEVYGL